MSDNSKIEWTDATWNPVTGCTKVSPGCDHCYAERVTERFHGKGSFENVTLHPGRLDQPLRWRKPRLIFVNSMSDLFHDDVPDEYIAQVFAVMACASQHTFQVLTKRHARMRSLLSSAEFRDAVNRLYVTLPDNRPGFCGYAWPLPNVWLGVSVETQQWADIRIPALLQTPAAVRFLSCEPLLGPVDLLAWLNGGFGTVAPDLHWVIVGGESGPGARPMHPAWARALRDECEAAGVAFHFKQWGEWAESPADGTHPGDVCLSEDGERYDVPKVGYVCAHNETDGAWLRRVGKRAAGRELDGRTHDGFPERVA